MAICSNLLWIYFSYKIFNLFMDEKSFKNLDFAYITAVIIIISWQYPTFSEIFELKVTK